jgi:hypothetical protein
MSVVSVVCCQVEVSASGWSLVQTSPTECGVSKSCVIVKPRKMRRPRPPRGCRATEKKYIGPLLYLTNVVRHFLSVRLSYYGTRPTDRQNARLKWRQEATNDIRRIT